MRIKLLSLMMLLCCVSVFYCSNLFAQTSTFVTDSLDTYIRQGMKDWQIPGLALVIVKDGKVVLAKGYGVKDIQTGERVDENGACAAGV